MENLHTFESLNEAKKLDKHGMMAEQIKQLKQQMKRM